MNSDGGDEHGISQEIPASFTSETGWPGEDECDLVTSTTTPTEWPLQFRRLLDVSGGISAVSVGDGWARFLENQNLGVGAFLTFEVVDDRCLVVAHHHRKVDEDIPLAQLTDVDTGAERERREREPPVAENSPPRQSNVLTQERLDDRLQFRKTLRKTHMKKHNCSRIVSANPNCMPPHRQSLGQSRVIAPGRWCWV